MLCYSLQFSSVTQSCLTLCDPMDPMEHTRPPCPSPTPGVYSNSCPLSRWCLPIISSFAIPFSSCLQSFPASVSFQMSQLFASGITNKINTHMHIVIWIYILSTTWIPKNPTARSKSVCILKIFLMVKLFSKEAAPNVHSCQQWCIHDSVSNKQVVST